MGGLPCRKEIIDQIEQLQQRLTSRAAALYQQLGCMRASILLAGTNGGSGIDPTDEEEAEFLAVTNALAEDFSAGADEVAKVAASIQAHVAGDSGG